MLVTTWPQRLAANMTPLENLSETEGPLLQVALTALRGSNESFTPSEHLIEKLLHEYGEHGRLDPKQLDEDVAEFKSDLNVLIEDAARLTNQYPALVRDAALTAA